MIGLGRGVDADAGGRQNGPKTTTALRFSEADATIAGVFGEGQSYLTPLHRTGLSHQDEWVNPTRSRPRRGRSCSVERAREPE